VLLLALCNSVTARQPVTVMMDDYVKYQPGDPVFITVIVSQPGGVNADSILVFVIQPNGVNNYSHLLPPTGGTVNFTLPLDAPLGNYTVVATWNYLAGQYATTRFTVIYQPLLSSPFSARTREAG